MKGNYLGHQGWATHGEEQGLYGASQSFDFAIWVDGSTIIPYKESQWKRLHYYYLLPVDPKEKKALADGNLGSSNSSAHLSSFSSSIGKIMIATRKYSVLSHVKT